MKLQLGTKIILAVVAALLITCVVCQLVQARVVRAREIELTRRTMRLAIEQGEQVREHASKLLNAGAYDREKLVAELKASDDLRKTTIYKTIPIVSAWEIIGAAAQKEGFEFRIPKHQPRNPVNEPTPEEAEILRTLGNDGDAEFFQVNDDKNEIVFARPIVLSADCLMCHGDPKHSPTGDGKDIVGGPMEGWKTGEVRGAFVLKRKFTEVDGVVWAGVWQASKSVLPAAFFILGGFVFMNRRTIVQPLNEAVAGIEGCCRDAARSASEIARGSQNLAEGASEQAASLEETSAALEEMTAMTRRNAANAVNAKDATKQARDAADAGLARVQEMGQTIGTIKTAVAEMEGAVREIHRSSDEVGKIIKTIDEIAFQTNLLALNAAVEAARAGEAGMGFAVVADEVRVLAQRSAQAARDTADKIVGAMKSSENGVRSSQRVAQSLGEVEATSGNVEQGFQGIVSRIQTIDQITAEIATACQEQSEGIAQVSLAMNQMDKTTQSSAAHAEEQAAAAQSLDAQSTSLEELVCRLRAIIAGGIAPAVPAGPSTAGVLPRLGKPRPGNPFGPALTSVPNPQTTLRS